MAPLANADNDKRRKRRGTSTQYDSGLTMPNTATGNPRGGPGKNELGVNLEPQGGYNDPSYGHIIGQPLGGEAWGDMANMREQDPDTQGNPPRFGTSGGAGFAPQLTQPPATKDQGQSTNAGVERYNTNNLTGSQTPNYLATNEAKQEQDSSQGGGVGVMDSVRAANNFVNDNLDPANYWPGLPDQQDARQINNYVEEQTDDDASTLKQAGQGVRAGISAMGAETAEAARGLTRPVTQFGSGVLGIDGGSNQQANAEPTPDKQDGQQGGQQGGQQASPEPGVAEPNPDVPTKRGPPNRKTQPLPAPFRSGGQQGGQQGGQGGQQGGQGGQRGGQVPQQGQGPMGAITEQMSQDEFHPVEDLGSGDFAIGEAGAENTTIYRTQGGQSGETTTQDSEAAQQAMDRSRLRREANSIPSLSQPIGEFLGDVGRTRQANAQLSRINEMEQTRMQEESERQQNALEAQRQMWQTQAELAQQERDSRRSFTSKILEVREDDPNYKKIQSMGPDGMEEELFQVKNGTMQPVKKRPPESVLASIRDIDPQENPEAFVDKVRQVQQDGYGVPAEYMLQAKRLVEQANGVQDGA